MITNRPALIEALRAEECALVERLVDLEETARKLAAVRYLIELNEPSESSVSTRASAAVITAPEPQISAVSEQDEATVVTTTAAPEEIGQEPQEAAIFGAGDGDERIDPFEEPETRPEPQDSYAAEIGDIERRERERDATLTELWPTELSVAEIGARIGRSGGWVSSRARSLGLPTRAGRNRRDEPAIKADRKARDDEDEDDAPAAVSIPVVNGAALTALLALPANGCHWPIGDPGTPDFRFCGKVRGDGRDPYCEGHQRMARGRQ